MKYIFLLVAFAVALVMAANELHIELMNTLTAAKIAAEGGK